jgi:hypothetical protein
MHQAPKALQGNLAQRRHQERQELLEGRSSGGLHSKKSNMASDNFDVNAVWMGNII